MNKIFCLLGIFIFFSACHSASTGSPSGKMQERDNGNFKLVWNDEFDYTGQPDSSKWSFEIGNGKKGWGNNELEYYTNHLSNANVKEGKLVITARKEQIDGFNYTSARLITQHKFAFTYGRIDVSAKLPGGKGIWPAIWMLGDDIETVGWPACGEVDIMEHIGKEPDRIHGSIHTPSSFGNTLNTAIINVPDCEAAFHVYSVEWDKQEIRYYIDNSFYYSYHPDVYNDDTWPFNKKLFIILNVAVGGNFGGAVDANIFPQSMEVGFVRVFQKD